jgi:hypothetical protein
MSLKTLLQEIFGSIKKVFKKLDQPLKDAYTLGFSLQTNSKPLLRVKRADILTAIIPGTIDDKIKERLRVFLPKILIELKLVENCAPKQIPMRY